MRKQTKGESNRNHEVRQRPRQDFEVQTQPAQKRDPMNFGLLKVRSMKTKQAQAIIYRDSSKNNSLNFDRMPHDRLIKIIEEAKDIKAIRELSKWFAKTNGIYDRAVRYLSDIYRFDYLLYPNLDLDSELSEKDNKNVLKNFNKLLEHFDNSSIQLMARRWASTVCTEGAYYGYICDDVNDKLVIQDLPIDYCRSRFLYRGKPLIEFNVRYFDDITGDDLFRKRLLDLFPPEFKKAYNKYKNGLLPAETQGDQPGWILLDKQRAFKFNFGSSDADIPPFAYAIPALIELGEVQDLEKEKLLQQLQKILVQTFALDKNGQIPFTMGELQQLNQNAIDMVGDAVGVSVLSTVADVHLEDLSPQKATESEASVDAAENSAYNNLGISTNLFNTDGNLALEKSTITDESFVKPLLLQFEQFFNDYITWKFNKAKNKFRMKMLTTTIFNYQELSSRYEALTKIGFSRFLPMVALGHTQKEVTSMARLEQEILDLNAIMLPPFSSNTMSSDTFNEVRNIQKDEEATGQNKNANPVVEADNSNEGGRPEKPDDQKSEKTIANQESAN